MPAWGVPNPWAMARFNADARYVCGVLALAGAHEPEAAAINAGLPSVVASGAHAWDKLGEGLSPGDVGCECPPPTGADVVVLLDAFMDPRAAAALRELLARAAVSGAGGAGVAVVQLASAATVEEGLLRASGRAARGALADGLRMTPAFADAARALGDRGALGGLGGGGGGGGLFSGSGSLLGGTSSILTTRAGTPLGPRDASAVAAEAARVVGTSEPLASLTLPLGQSLVGLTSNILRAVDLRSFALGLCRRELRIIRLLCGCGQFTTPLPVGFVAFIGGVNRVGDGL